MLAHQLLGVLVLLGLSSSVVTEERERRTHELLLATRISPLEIALSKLGALWVYVGLVALAALPAASLFYLLGGIAFDDVLRHGLENIAMLTLVGMLGVASSMVSATTGAALAKASGVTLILAIWMHTPFFVTAAERSVAHWFFKTAVAGLVIGGYLWCLSDRALLDEPTRPTSTLADREAFQKPDRFTALTEEMLLRFRRGERWCSNPVFLRELYAPPFHCPWFRRAMFFGLFGALFLYASPWWSPASVFHRIWTVAVGAMVLIVPPVVAPIVPRELASGGFDALRSTPLTADTVVQGKYLAALYAAAGLPSAAVWWTALAGLLTWGSPGLIWLAMTIVAFYAMACAAGLCVGSYTRTTGGAIAGTYFVLIAMLVVGTFVHSIGSPHFSSRPHPVYGPRLGPGPELSLIAALLMLGGFRGKLKDYGWR